MTMPTDELFQVNLTQADKTALLKRAALLTAATGKRHTMSDLVREALRIILSSPIDEPASAQAKALKFTPTPAVDKAIRQAHFNSGKPVNEIINEGLVEAFQLQEMSL